MSIATLARRVLAVSALAVAPLLGAATHAANRFHLALKHAEPGVSDTVATSPKMLKLWFTESVSPATTGVRLMNAKEEVLKVGDVTVESSPMSPAVVAVPEKLGAGTYTVMWRAMADDGHPSTGKFTFTVK
ncbi:MAG TPA: copper resistance CopC family protein [Gemmatimonadaceae bacterium]|jgi:methionine-rich copper-binding protein CopC